MLSHKSKFEWSNIFWTIELPLLNLEDFFFTLSYFEFFYFFSFFPSEKFQSLKHVNTLFFFLFSGEISNPLHFSNLLWVISC